MKKKCVYCGKAVREKALSVTVRNRAFPVCCNTCLKKTADYVKQDGQFKTFLYLLIGVAALIILLFSRKGGLGVPVYAALGAAGAGFFFFPYPISSFETFFTCSIQKTKRICQVLGILLIVAAVLFLLFVQK